MATHREALASRPAPQQEEAAGLVFVTTRGRPWLSRGIANPVWTVWATLAGRGFGGLIVTRQNLAKTNAEPFVVKLGAPYVSLSVTLCVSPVTTLP